MWTNREKALYKGLGGIIRERRGSTMSQERLAFLIGLTRTSVSNIEAGRQRMLLGTLTAIAKALGTSGSALLRRAER